MIENISDEKGNEIANIIYSSFQREGIEFITNNESSLQLAYMSREAGHKIQPHMHLPRNSYIKVTQEVLFIKSGSVRLELYDNNKVFICSRKLGSGDVIQLVSGGHGFEMIEMSEIIEVKQGPYSETRDKERF